MTYVDGFVAAVPTKNKEAFLKHAVIGADCFKEAGALRVMDCWGDDVPDGKVTSFPMAVKKQPDETVIFSFIIWPDKATRDAGMQKALADPRMQPDVYTMPFDSKRVILGGFETILEN